MTIRRQPRGNWFGWSSLSRYDFVLAVLPLAFALAAVIGSVAEVSFQVTLAAASLFGGALVTDALFVNPPVER